MYFSTVYVFAIAEKTKALSFKLSPDETKYDM